MALICDTGPLFAALHRRDRAHAACARLLGDTRARVVIPAPVVVELDWLVRSRLGGAAFDAFLGDVEAGAFEVEELRPPDYARARDLCQQYGDLGLGFVDAAVAAVADRLHESRLATLDHRHFSVLRSETGKAYELLPG